MLNISRFVDMDALIVYPENKEQLDALKAVVKAMKIPFEQKNSYPENVVQGVKKSLKQAQDNGLKPFDGLNEMLDLH